MRKTKVLQIILDNIPIKVWKKLVEFKTTYLDTTQSICWNHIRISKKNGLKHNLMVCQVCCWLLENNIPFTTEHSFKNKKYIPDIICPTHVKKIIEVRCSETEKMSLAKLKNIPEELREQIIYVDAKQEFNEKLLL